MTATQLDYEPPQAFPTRAAGWATITSGVNPDKHGVKGPTEIDAAQATKGGHPDFLSRIEELAPKLNTFSATDWGNLGQSVNGGPIISDAVDVKHATSATGVAAYDAQDQADADAAVALLRSGAQHAGFVYFGLVNETAAVSGPTSPAYAQAIATTDARIGQLLQALSGQDWTVIVTSSRGQPDLALPTLLPVGIGAAERGTFVVAAGAGVPQDPRGSRARVVDIHPTVLTRVGLPGAPDLDGLPFAISTVQEATSFFGAQRAARAFALRRARKAARGRRGAKRRGL